MRYLNTSLKKYLEELSSPAPVPGGGGTSAYVAALGASLGLMVAGIIQKKIKGNARIRRLRISTVSLNRLKNAFARAVDEDPRVYGQVMNAYRKARKIKNRAAAKRFIDGALKRSFLMQQGLAVRIAEARKHIRSLEKLAAGSIANDLLVASALLEGASKGAYATARINVEYIHQPKLKHELTRQLKKTPR